MSLRDLSPLPLTCAERVFGQEARGEGGRERAQLVEEFDPQHPYKKLRVGAWASNPNTGEVGTDRSLRFAVPPD